MKKKIKKLTVLILIVLMLIASVPIANLAAIDETTTYQVGDIIQFGSYPQSKNSNGTFVVEPIDWRVLSVSGNTAFLLSEKILDFGLYHSSNWYSVTWENSKIRTWLNDTFYNKAFDETEQLRILSTFLKNEDNPTYNIDAGNDTTDKIFLLSLQESINSDYGFLNKYNEHLSRVASATEYAKYNGVYIRGNNNVADWWLRTPGSDASRACVATYRGYTHPGGASVNFSGDGIRPAMRIKLTDVEDAPDDTWKEDKVKIEFRFANTKEIIDTSDQYSLDRQVAFNFTTTEDVHRMLNATNGILYMDDFYFPINYFNASWSSAFGDKTEYSCKSTKIIDANAGDTIVVYMSPNENQGSVTTKLAEGKTNNYGANNTSSTIEGHIRETAKELAEYIDEYISLINGSNLKKKNNNAEEPMQNSANALKNASARDKIYSVPPKAEFEYALCYALATVFKEETEEKIDLGKINLNKSKEEIALNLTKKLLSNFSEVDETVVCGNYKVKINLTMFGKAFTGSYYIYNKKGNILFGPGLVNSNQDSTTATLKAYYMSMTDLVNDMLKASMAAIFTELSDVTGLTDYRESALNDSVKNALSYLEKKGFGKVKDLLMTGREIYINIKDIASATSDLTVSNLLKTEEKTRELYEIVFNNSFTSSKASDTAAKEIISKIEATRKELYNLLYNKLYGINRDDAGVLTKVGNWIEAKILCPVDVEVYNADGELIGYVDTLGRHDEFIYYSDGIYIEVRGDEKFVYYPVGKTITFKFYGTDNGSMTYSLETLVDGESVDRFNYYNVALSEDCEYSQTIEADTSFSESMDALVLIGDSKTYTGEYLSVDDETAHIRVLYSSTEGGCVSGDMYYPKGNCATLYAYAQEGYAFKGWYENEKCISEEEVYRFAATRDFILEARFEKIKVDNDVENETPVLDRILLSEKELILNQGEQEPLYYVAIPTTSNANIQWTSADPSVATVDENGIVTAVAKGATTVSVVDTATNINVQCRVVVDDERSCVYLDHNFKDWYYVNLADCEMDGLKQRGCIYCDYFETKSIPATGHSYESVVTQATCKDKGYTTYTCVCGDSYIGDYVNTIDHKYTAKITTQATHLTQGIKTYTCDCGTCYTETIAKLPDHTYIKVINLPTCTSEGYTTYICDCGDTYTGDKTPAKGHDYAEGVCKNCGDSKVDNCSCNCHKSGLMGIIWKILRFFYKLFKINPVCGCGVSHY